VDGGGVSERLAHFWAWARVPLAIGVGTRVALWLYGVAGLMWIGPSRATMFPGRPLIDPWFRWDAGWYMQIASAGYSLAQPEPGQRNTFFFPLYPLSVRAVGWLLGGDLGVAALVVSNVCFVAALVVLFRFVRERWDEATATLCVALLACAPHALFFSAAYAESLFLLCWVSAFYAGHRGRWLWAGLFVALSGAARGVGPIAMSGVGLLALERARWKLRDVDWRVLLLGLGPLGLASYMAYLHVAFGDMWLFTGGTSVQGWGAGHDLGKLIGDLLAWRSGTASIADLSHLLGLGLATAVTASTAKRLGAPLAVFSVLTLLVYWSVWYSASRYLVVLFPLFIAFALLLRPHPRLTVAFIYGSALMQGMMTWIFTHADWVS
jgi:hypothetical protein